MVPDMTSFGSFTSHRTAIGSLQYRKNHEIIFEKFGIVERGRVKLLTKWDIVLFNVHEDTIKNWCIRVHQLHSGQFVGIFLSSNTYRNVNIM